jgi:hypothetical protein
MRHLVYSVRYSVIPMNSSLLNIITYSSVRTTLVSNDIHSFVTVQQSSVYKINKITIFAEMLANEEL